MMNTTNEVQVGPLLFGAALGLGILFLIDPHHGETRRSSLKRNCQGVGQQCQNTWASLLKRWTSQLTHATSDFQAEIRANASPYLQ